MTKELQIIAYSLAVVAYAVVGSRIIEPWITGCFLESIDRQGKITEINEPLLERLFLLGKGRRSVAHRAALLKNENQRLVLKGGIYGNLFFCDSQQTFYSWSRLSMAKTYQLSEVQWLSALGTRFCFCLFWRIWSALWAKAIPVSGVSMCFKTEAGRVFQTFSGTGNNHPLQCGI